MNDGPFKSPNMHARWRRVAGYADMEAYSPVKIAERLFGQLARDFEEISPKLPTSLRQAFGDDRQEACLRSTRERGAGFVNLLGPNSIVRPWTLAAA
jgi:hypothetical protein